MGVKTVTTAQVFGLVGGLGLFLFGMQLMGEGLQRAAGDRVRRILELLTSVPLIGTVVGAVVTALVQSSSATTVMVVGFVNAGLMTLKQAVSVILGANIGTTITGQLVALKLTDYALPAIGLGVLLQFLAKKRRQRYLGQVLLGFGLLFLGMGTMSAAVKPLQHYTPFQEMMLSFSHNPWLGILVSAGFTAVIQSSSATTGVIIAMAGQNLLDLNAALALILGSNVGTCITALLASIGTNLTARRAAVAHVAFNVLGVVIFLPFLSYFAELVQSTSLLLPRQIANAHTFFNVFNTILVLPLISLFVAAIVKLVPGQPEIDEAGARYIDPRLLGNPGVAFAQVEKEILRMSKIANQNVKDAFSAFLSGNEALIAQVLKKEDQIDRLEQVITDFLAQLAQSPLSPEQSERVTHFLHIVNDVERIGDHAENLAELAEYKIQHRLPFSEEAIRELKEMLELVTSTFEAACRALEGDDAQLALEVIETEGAIDKLEKDLRNHHIQRLGDGRCNSTSGIIFLDIISNLERVGDHAANIAHIVVEGV